MLRQWNPLTYSHTVCLLNTSEALIASTASTIDTELQYTESLSLPDLLEHRQIVKSVGH